MRGTLTLAAALLLLIAPACGHDEKTTGSADSGRSAGTHTADTGHSTSSTTATAETSSGGCPASYPAPVDPPYSYRGFVELCATSSGTSMLIRNVSQLVLRVTPDRYVNATDVTAPPDSFTASAVSHFAPAVCDTRSCTLPPGASLDMTGSEPVGIVLGVATGATASAVLTKVLAGWIEQRLTTRGAAMAERVATCAQQAGETLSSGYWEEAFRNAAEGLPTCTPLFDELAADSGTTRRALTGRLIARARSLSGGTWVDGLLAATKAVHAIR